MTQESLTDEEVDLLAQWHASVILDNIEMFIDELDKVFINSVKDGLSEQEMDEAIRQRAQELRNTVSPQQFRKRLQ